MINLRSFCTILLLIGAINNIQAQKRYAMYKKAEETLYKENFSEALILYEKIQEIDSTYEDIQYKIEICRLLSNRQYTDMNPFSEYQKRMSKRDKFYYYWKGRALMQHYAFEDAVESLETFITSPTKKSNEIKQESNRWSSWAKLAKKYIDNPEFYEIHLLETGVNTEKTELNPIYFEDKKSLLFLSNRDETKPDVFQMYYTRQSEDENWSDPSIMSSLGTFTRDNSNIEISNKGEELLQFQSGKGRGLYVNRLGESMADWSASNKYDIGISSNKINPQFFLNENKDWIIFAKNVGTAKKPNFDLFQSFKNSRTENWSNPKVLSTTLNSKYNEKNPYLSPDETTLYFVSDGHETMGGYDIFKTQFDSVTSAWSEPVNMGFPINSPDNEIDYRLNKNQTSGSFISNRLHTHGDYDIFFFKEIPYTIKIKGRVIDKSTGDPVTDGEIFFRPVNYTDFYFFSLMDEQGLYHMKINADSKYKVEFKQKGKKLIPLDDFGIHITQKTNSTIVKDFYIGGGSSTIKTDIKNLNEINNSNDRVVLRNIYFDFASNKVKDESLPILQAILIKMNESPQIKIKIAGHTDNIGSNKYNQALSQKRANTVVNWLIKNGVSKDRLTAKGYGETKPMVSNDDEFEGRELNRRIEVIVL